MLAQIVTIAGMRVSRIAQFNLSERLHYLTFLIEQQTMPLLCGTNVYLDRTTYN